MTPLLALFEIADILTIAALLILFTSASALAARRPDTSRRIERKLDALMKHHGVELPTGLSVAVQHLARDPARKIAAIKLHREDHPGLGLAEAKADVEDFLSGVR